MSRINTNVASMLGQRVLGMNNQALNTSLERLSTGLRINRGKDDPAGLIASENLRAQQTAISKAIGNAERADQVVNIAEGGLTEISGLLNELQGLVTETANTAGLSREEKEANQLQIDSILQTIDRVASATSFQGTKLLNGTYDYETTSVSDNISSFQVNGAKLNHGDTLDVDVLVTNSAQVGGFLLSFGAGSLDLGASTDQFVVEIAGAQGSRELSFASGTSLTDIAAAINSFTDVTGVEATVSGSNTAIRLDSAELGADEFVSIKVVDDGSFNDPGTAGIYNYQTQDTGAADTGSHTDFTNAGNPLKDSGQDVEATINGIVATTKGTTARINTDFLDVEIDLKTGSSSGADAQVLGNLDAFTIEGGGADFQLAGEVDINGKVSVGIQNVAVRDIGQSELTVSGSTDNFFLADLGSGKSLNVVDGDTAAAQKVVDKAIREISSMRGRLGAFQKNTVGATIRNLGISLENTAAAESVVRDTDFAAETASLTRNQILVSSATNVLGLSNSQPQSVLQLLG